MTQAERQREYVSLLDKLQMQSDVPLKTIALTLGIADSTLSRRIHGHDIIRTESLLAMRLLGLVGIHGGTS